MAMKDIAPGSSWKPVFETEICSGFVRPRVTVMTEMRPIGADRPTQVSPMRRCTALVLALAVQTLFVGVWVTNRHVDAPPKLPSLVMIDLPRQDAPAQTAKLPAPSFAMPQVNVPLPLLPEIA